MALVVSASPANADGDTVITIGPSQYSGGFDHPTGTVSIGGGTISARCTAIAVKGSATFQTPACVTKKITCPATATICTMILNFRESALRGPVYVGAALVLYSGAASYVSSIQAYNCPQAFSCGARQFYLVAAGTTLQSAVFNTAYAPNYPNVFNQVTLTVH